MDREQALRLVRSELSHERLRAARALARSAIESDWPVLQSAYAAESVPWIKNSLSLTLARLRGETPENGAKVAPLDDQADDMHAEIHAQAVEDTTRKILHEFAGPLGHAQIRAATEFDNYEGSKTQEQLDRLGRLIEAFEVLHRVASTPQTERFDVRELVTVTAYRYLACEGSDVKPVYDVPGRLHGATVSTYSGRALVEVALANGIKNAAEATLQAYDSGDPPAVVISWGETERDCWVSIIDQGAGLPPGFQHAFELGRTSKRGHLGVGLALARQAIETLGGSIALQEGDSGGCRLDFSWPRARFEDPCES